MNQAIGLYKAINELKASKPRLDFSVWFELGKLNKELTEPIAAFDLKFDELLDDCAEKDDDGKRKMLPTNPPSTHLKDPERFNEGIEKLNEEVVEVEIVKIPQAKFEGVEMEGSDNMFTLFELVIE